MRYKGKDFSWLDSVFSVKGYDSKTIRTVNDRLDCWEVGLARWRTSMIFICWTGNLGWPSLPRFFICRVNHKKESYVICKWFGTLHEVFSNFSLASKVSTDGQLVNETKILEHGLKVDKPTSNGWLRRCLNSELITWSVSSCSKSCSWMKLERGMNTKSETYRHISYRELRCQCSGYRNCNANNNGISAILHCDE